MNTGKSSSLVLASSGYLIAAWLRWTDGLEEHKRPFNHAGQNIETSIHRASEQSQPISHKESIVKNKIPLSFKTGSKFPSTEGTQESSDNCVGQLSTESSSKLHESFRWKQDSLLTTLLTRKTRRTCQLANS